MIITFSDNPIIRLKAKFDNWYEKYASKVWRSKPHKATCCICGETIRSTDKYNWSPEERGWGRIDNGTKFICHMCMDHRDFKNYIPMIDRREEIC